MRWWLLSVLSLFALPAMAQERPLSGAEFGALVEGKTMDTFDLDGLFGVETFLPGRKTLWRDSERCLKGTWTETDGMICYTYEGDAGPFCSTFYDRGDWIIGFRGGVWGSDPIMLYPSRDVVTCEDFLGS
ncbi:MAG: hypothetical protein ACRCSW_09335 [Tabrizicola sp.]